MVYRKLIKQSVLVLLLALIALQLTSILRQKQLSIRVADDFIEYWSAARLNRLGQNPYNEQKMLSLQQSVSADISQATMMWNPPWTLALVAPLERLSFLPARVIWLLMNLAFLVGSVLVLWKEYGGRGTSAVVPLILCVAFAPAVFVIGMGQISVLLLLGVTGFIYFEHRGRPLTAGACASLILVKPHLLLLFWFAVVFWSIDRRNYRTLLGASLMVMALGIVPWLANPDVYTYYFDAATNRPPSHWIAPTLGSLLRLLFGWEKLWLLFLPSAIGIIWLGFYWRRHRANWSWSQRLPTVVFVAVITSAYGWAFDQVLLLVPVVQAAAHLSHRSLQARGRLIAIFLAVNLAAFVLWAFSSTLVHVNSSASSTDLLREVLSRPNSFWFILLAPMLFLWYHGCVSRK